MSIRVSKKSMLRLCIVSVIVLSLKKLSIHLITYMRILRFLNCREDDSYIHAQKRCYLVSALISHSVYLFDEQLQRDFCESVSTFSHL